MKTSTKIKIVEVAAGATVVLVMLAIAFVVGLLFRLPQVMTFHDWRCLVVECRLVK